MKMERILPVLLVALPPIIVALVAKFIVGASSIIGAFNAVLGLLAIIPLGIIVVRMFSYARKGW